MTLVEVFQRNPKAVAIAKDDVDGEINCYFNKIGEIVCEHHNADGDICVYTLTIHDLTLNTWEDKAEALRKSKIAKARAVLNESGITQDIYNITDETLGKIVDMVIDISK